MDDDKFFEAFAKGSPVTIRSGAGVKLTPISREIFGVTTEGDPNCLNVNTEIFTPDRGSPSYYAYVYCAGCEIRVDCLTTAFEQPIKRTILGGMSIKSQRKMQKFLNSVGTKVLPQKEAVASQYHVEFMIKLKAYELFKENFGIEPTANSKIVVPKGTQILLANGKVIEMTRDYEVYLKPFVDLIEADNGLKETFFIELARAGYRFSKTNYEVVKYRHAYLKWRIANPNEKYFPLDAIMKIEKGELLFSGTGHAFIAPEDTIVDFAPFLRSKGLRSSYIDGERMVWTKDLDSLYKVNKVENNKVKLHLELEKLDDLSFEVFIAGYKKWLASSKSENIGPDTLVTLKRGDFSSQTLEAIGVPNSSSPYFTVDIGLTAFQIRTKEEGFHVTQEQASELLELDFIFDIDHFVTARSFEVLRRWAEEYPDRQLSLANVTETYPQDAKSGPKRGGEMQLPSGVEVAMNNGQTIITRHAKRVKASSAFSHVVREYRMGRLNEEQLEFLRSAGFIFDAVEIKKAIRQTLGLAISSDEHNSATKYLLGGPFDANGDPISCGSREIEYQLNPGTVVSVGRHGTLLIKETTYATSKHVSTDKALLTKGEPVIYKPREVADVVVDYAGITETGSRILGGLGLKTTIAS